jgi:hypothetical protein
MFFAGKKVNRRRAMLSVSVARTFELLARPDFGDRNSWRIMGVIYMCHRLGTCSREKPRRTVDKMAFRKTRQMAALAACKFLRIE